MIIKKSYLYKNIIIFTDICTVCFAYLFAFWFRLIAGFFPKTSNIVFSHLHLITLMGVVIFQIYIFLKNGLYDENTFLRRINQIPIIIKSSFVSIVLLMFISFITKDNPFLERRGVIMIAVSTQIVFMIIFRILVFRNIFHYLLKKGIGKERIIIIGPDITATRLKNALIDFDKYRFEIKKIINEKEFSMKKFKNIFSKFNIDMVFVIQEKLTKDEILNIVAYCKNNKKHIFLLSNMFDVAISKVDVSTFENIPVIDLSLPGGKEFHLLSKRLFDIIGSAILLILLSPIFLLIAILIKIDSKGSVIFSQKRIGRNNKEFNMLKFRTMYQDNDNAIHKEYIQKLIKQGEKDKSGVFKIEDDPRITKIGKFLRKHSLDELPQLENVLIGQMSLVGPRPPLDYEVKEYSEWHKRRLSVNPGMTGLWQVSGRNKIGFEDMVLLDIYYAENWTIWMDFQILLRTIPVVLFKKDGR